MADINVIAVDDDADVLKAITLALQPQGIVIETLSDPAHLLARVPVGDVLLVDLNFSRGANSNQEGLRLIEDIRVKDRNVAIVVITAFGGMNVAVEAMKRGADDFISKPWSNPQLVHKVREASEISRARRGAAPAANPASVVPFLAESSALRAAHDSLRRIASTGLSVLILGETGVGKSRLAQEVFAPGRALTPFSAETPPHDSIIFIRELSDLSAEAQAQLVGLLNQRPRRVVSTSNRTREDLRQRVRADLLSRVAGVEVLVPPLRERPEDALLLLREALRAFENKHGRPARTLDESALVAARGASWPGAARAVLQAAERAVMLSSGASYTAEDFGLSAGAPAPTSTPIALVDVEAEAVRRALADNSYNVSHAAKQLGISRAALYRRMEKHGL
ncbi:MAG: sigma-54-dependent Fis family transcriptional regulator [Caulobacterales bacterium]|nr:sigma-54-dependent Fis family transcriptional regulator [Caulobacterales bacterium]